jgi:hypothetical protein
MVLAAADRACGTAREVIQMHTVLPGSEEEGRATSGPISSLSSVLLAMRIERFILRSFSSFATPTSQYSIGLFASQVASTIPFSPSST